MNERYRCTGSGGAVVGPFDSTGRTEMGHCEVCGERVRVRRTDGNAAVHKLPERLLASDAFVLASKNEDQQGALELWKMGFRPFEAHEVEEGMLAAYVTTMFGFTSDSQFRYGRILRVEVIEKDWEVEIAHTTEDGGDSVVEADWEDEVWAKA